MRRIPLILAALHMGGLPAIATDLPPEPPMTENTAAAELTTLYHAFNQAMTAADVAALDAMLTPTFTLTHMTGYVQPRAEWLEHIRSGQMQYQQIDIVNVRTSADGTQGHITGQAWNTANIWGMQGRWPLQLDISVEKNHGGWQITQAVASTF